MTTAEGYRETGGNWAYQEALGRIAQGISAGPCELDTVLSPETAGEEFYLFSTAHHVRLSSVGRSVQVRGIIEFSNYCRQDCLFCGLRRSNAKLARYRMSPEQIVEAAVRALKAHDFGTFVLQSGEDPGYPADAIAYAVKSIKQLGSAVTLSAGQRSYEDYQLWRKAGADRFLLKFETSDPDFFKQLKPTTTLDERLQCLMSLRSLGYQIGTGIILGLPGQTREMVIRDLLLLKQLDPEMVSIGPFIPHPDTPLGQRLPGAPDPDSLIRATLRAVALSRLMVPLAHIPATTALGVIGQRSRDWIEWAGSYIQGRLGDEAGPRWHAPTGDWNDPRLLALVCGANVIMPDVTPKLFRDSYEIYPGKAGSDGEELCGTMRSVKAMIQSLGMTIDPGRGDSPKPQFAAGMATGGDPGPELSEGPGASDGSQTERSVRCED
ncbi:MAG: [FeFe] hydrogenase H-cluster radical SAM maturase HydE [Bacillota bacterium]|jgi:biotin synthase|nr:[FeFe] hydrogenase H-cluster radical SAM maturase HydE [Candidatus Fermentithermobacillaceae bacterium]